MVLLRIWEKFQDIILILLIGFVLMGTYSFLMCFFWEVGWCLLKKLIGIRHNFVENFLTVLEDATAVSLVLSLFTTPLAIYSAATNDKLTLPIRLLGIAENFNKLLNAVTVTISCYCSVISYRTFSYRTPFQVLIPYALRFAIGYLGELCEKQLYDGWMYFYDPFVVYAPYFLTCALDFVIRRKMKKSPINDNSILRRNPKTQSNG